MSTINQPAKKSLSAIFDKNVYQIPKYQRAYSWEESNWIELWSDIENYVVKAEKEHFLGAIIHYHGEQARESKFTNFDIIDGQQRITTLTILIRVLYEKLKNSGVEIYSRFADEIYEKYIADKKSDCFYLSLSKKDDSFFRDYIQQIVPIRRSGKLVSNKNIRKCYEFFNEKIDIYTKDSLNAYEQVWELKKKIEENLIFVVIDVNTDVDAYMIFESINSKRQGLTISDLLKNYIFLSADQFERAHADSKKLRITEESWESMESVLDKIEINHYIRHYWISKYEKVFEKDLYQAIKLKFKVSYNEILDFFSNVCNESEIYASIVNADISGLSEKSARSLEQLKSLRNKQYYPLLLSAMVTSTLKSDVENLITQIASVAVRRSLSGRNPNELEQFFGDKASALRNNEVTIPTLITELSEKFWISDEEILAELAKANFKDQEYLAKFLLREFEYSSNYANEKKLVSVSLEHVLPRNPDKIEDWDIGEHSQDDLVWNIGNLSLISQKLNNKMSNSSFIKKRKWLEKSDLNSTKSIASKEKWGFEEIAHRNSVISNFVVKEWSKIQ